MVWIRTVPEAEATGTPNARPSAATTTTPPAHLTRFALHRNAA
jgi:hypothetical protein